MMTNRRDLLKFFGAGARIAPVIARRAEIAETARLAEGPRIIRIQFVRGSAAFRAVDISK